MLPVCHDSTTPCRRPAGVIIDPKEASTETRFTGQRLCSRHHPNGVAGYHSDSPPAGRAVRATFCRHLSFAGQADGVAAHREYRGTEGD